MSAFCTALPAFIVMCVPRARWILFMHRSLFLRHRWVCRKISHAFPRVCCSSLSLNLSLFCCCCCQTGRVCLGHLVKKGNESESLLLLLSAERSSSSGETAAAALSLLPAFLLWLRSALSWASFCCVGHCQWSWYAVGLLREEEERLLTACRIGMIRRTSRNLSCLFYRGIENFY